MHLKVATVDNWEWAKSNGKDVEMFTLSRSKCS